VWLARRLLSLLPADENVLVLDCGPAPENAFGALRRFGPGLVLLLDAADFGGAAGEVRWIDPLQTSGFSASSHSLPFAVLAAYLARELACQVALLGIQPAGLEFDAGLSSPVKNSLSLLLKDLLALLQE
jgi:hydrogenase 3 maturation protease